MAEAVNFNAHLSKQLGFLQRSCDAYDSGYSDEAIRIATVIRVLVHQTNASTSLLKHLGATTINLLSTTLEPSPQTLSFIGMGMLRVGDGNSEYRPHLGDGPISETVPVSKWWSQTVMVIGGHRIARRNVVLAASNKDGGAHVDSSLTPEYEALAKDGAVGYFVQASDGKCISEPIGNAHLVTLRQMGYEILSSQELLVLRDG